MFTEIPLIFQLLILLFSVVVHEVSHGLAALRLGDDTAEKMGRLTLNPLKHLDPIGSVILPMMLVLMKTGFIFGWAKPVPYNPLNLKMPRRDSAILAFAGPIANFSLALIIGLIIRIIISTSSFVFLLPFLMFIVWINLVLGIFNLLPIPPLDGSKILFYFFPSRELEIFLHQYGIILLFLFIMFGGAIILPIIYFFFSILTGIPLG
jgi:Zn-dependent protease